MPEKRKKYDAEFREGAVRIVEETRKPIAQVARDLGVNEGTLGHWVSLARAARDGHGELVKDDCEELRRLRAEVAELRMERDVLKCSVVLWVKGATSERGTLHRCGTPVLYSGRGRRPIWCSARCRTQACERRGNRMAGVAPRVVEVVRVRVVAEKSAPAASQVDSRHRSVEDWAKLLEDLHHALVSGVLYDREMIQLIEPLNGVLKGVRAPQLASVRRQLRERAEPPRTGFAYDFSGVSVRS